MNELIKVQDKNGNPLWVKEAILVKRPECKVSNRLEALVNAIPELEISRGYVECTNVVRRTIYDASTGYIDYNANNNEIWLNPLKNKKKLKTKIKCGVMCVTEESFCDLLEEHLYLVAKNARKN